MQQDKGRYLSDLLYHSSTSVYLPTRPSHFIPAGIWRGWCSRTRVDISLTCSTTHLPVFTYLLSLPTSSLLTSGGVGAAGQGLISLPCSTTHLPVFTYLLGLPTSSLLTSGGVGAAGQGLISLTCSTTHLPVFTTYLAFPLHLC